VLVSGAFLLWFFVVELFFNKGLTGGLRGYSIYGVVMMAALVVLALLDHRTQQAQLMGSVTRRVMLGVRQAVGVSTLVLFFLVATKDTAISRTFLFSFMPVLFVVLPATNLLLPSGLLPLLFRGSSSEACLLLSWDGISHRSKDRRLGDLKMRDVALWLQSQSRYGMRILGMLGHDGALAREAGITLLGEPESLRDALASTKATSLILMQMPPQRELLTHAIDVCESMGVRLSVLYDFQEHFGRPVQLIQLDGMNILQFRSEPLQNPVRRGAKRAFDILFSGLVVLLILPPVALVVWVLHRLQSPGPLFYRQTRTGRGGSPFQIIKFRSMHTGSYDESQQARKCDDRIFPAGAILRKMSLDELPQFLNVLCGDMSVVGPRPHLHEHNEVWKSFLRPYHVRSLVRPGITGLAQSRGLRGEAITEEEIRQRVSCDIEYIERWSFLFDLGLVARTALQVIFPKKSAY
jgi:hypothetical protein